MENRKYNLYKTSYSERMAEFFSDDHKWTPVPKKESLQPQRSERNVTWARWPNRYVLEQSAEVEHRLFRKPALKRQMFDLMLMSAARASDGLHELERWCIVPLSEERESIYHFQHLVESPEAESHKGEMKQNIDFVLDNNLYVPNNKDLEKLDYILEIGYMDGYERLG